MDTVRIARRLVALARELQAASYKVGDLVKFVGRRRVYRVERVDQFGNYDLQATTGGFRGSRPSGIPGSDLVPADADVRMTEVVDKKGRTAPEAAKDLGRWVVVDMWRLERERLGQVTGITKTGRVKVQTYYGGEWEGQEKFTPDKRDKGEVIVFKPDLYHGEWTWGTRDYHIKRPYKGGQLSSLLD